MNLIEELKSILQESRTPLFTKYGRCVGCDSDHPDEYHEVVNGKVCSVQQRLLGGKDWQSRLQCVIETLEREKSVSILNGIGPGSEVKVVWYSSRLIDDLDIATTDISTHHPHEHTSYGMVVYMSYEALYVAQTVAENRYSAVNCIPINAIAKITKLQDINDTP